MSSTSLYAPFRSLGHVTTDVPFAIHSHSTKDAAVLGAVKTHTDSQVILTSVGLGWALWSADGLRLLYVGPLTPSPISCLAVDSTGLVLASAADRIYIYKRVRLVGVLKTSSGRGAKKKSKDLDGDEDMDEDGEDWINQFPSDLTNAGTFAIHQFITFGNEVVGLSTCGTRIWIWNLNDRELRTIISLPATFGVATSLIHPATYLNRIVVASQDGQLALYNVQTGVLIHIFKSTLFSIPTKARSRGEKVPVTCMVQGPAVDVLAVGFGDGWCSLVDVRYGEEILAVKMGATDTLAISPDGINAITGAAFRSDSEAQLLITSSSQGHLAIWNLNDGGKLLHMIREAHNSAISSVHFLPGQPVLATASGDNSIKLWLFETPTSLPRLLTQRSGHQHPPHLIRYYGEDGKTILSTGGDRTLRATSVVRDSRSFELSQGSLAKKASQLAAPVASLRLPSVSDISYSTSRSKDWDDLLTCHEGSSQARTWSVQNKRLGKHRFTLHEKKSFQMDPPAEVARCACVTACGNYGLVGTQGSGVIGMWNMQSGMKRREFKLPKSSSKGKSRETTHHVVGISTDSLNKVVIVATRSGLIHFFDFVSTSLKRTVTFGCNISGTSFQRNSGLLALNCLDLCIRILDIDTYQVIRELSGFKKPILDMTFSADSRWIVAASCDSIIRTFDLPTGALIDAFRTQSIATSVTFSPKGDFLASCHVDSVGIFLWANRAQFAGVSYKSLPPDYEIPLLESPVLEGIEDERAQEVEDSLRPDAWSAGAQLEDDELIPKQISSDNALITLSVMPKSKWQTLLNLDIIKARNKPKEPPKAPERAPFFLPTVAAAVPRFNLVDQVKQDGENEDTSSKATKKRKFDLGDGAIVEAEFTRRLSQAVLDENYTGFFEYVRELPPSALDLEIRSLSTSDQIISLIEGLTEQLKTGQDFEMVQAIMSLVWRVHGRLLIESGVSDADDYQMEEESSKGVLGPMRNLLLAQEETSQRLTRLVDYGIGVSAFVRGSTGVV